MAKIVVFHNEYRSSSPSGENSAVRADVDLLSRAGHEVHFASVSSDSIDESSFKSKVTAGINATYSLHGQRMALEALETIRPDVVHMHNLFPLWSPAVSRQARIMRIPRIQVVHNFRLSCLSANHLYKGDPCFACMGRRYAIPGLFRRCHGGLAQSASSFVSRAVNNSVLLDADHYLAVSPSVAERTIQAGVDENKVSVKPEYIDPLEFGYEGAPCSSFLFAARLDEDKGVRLLLDAYSRYWDMGGRTVLRIAGSGPLEDLVKHQSARCKGITFLGRIPGNQVFQEIYDAKAIIVPSIWEEPFGKTVIEAWRQQRPVISTGLGGAGDLVRLGGGWLAGPTVEELAVSMLAGDQVDTARRLGQEGYSLYRSRFSGAWTMSAYERAWQSIGVPL